MNHVAELLHILLKEKKRRIYFNTICLKLYQFKIIAWWCLFVLKSTLQFVVKYVLLEKYSKNHGLLKFALGPLLGGGPDANSDRPCTLIHNLPCRNPCRLFIDKVFFGPFGLHLLVWNELGWSPPFQPMGALTLAWSGAFCLVTIKFARAQKKVFKGSPKTPPKSWSVKSYVTGLSITWCLNEFLFMRVLTYDKIEKINGCEHLECRGLPVLC